MIQKIARAYGIPLIEWRASGSGLVIGSGCGTMMAVMDQLAWAHWCVDVDAIRRADYGEALAWLSRYAEPVAIVGWFSITDPTQLRRCVEMMSSRPLAYTPFTDLGARHVDSLAEFLAALGADRSPDPYRDAEEFAEIIDKHVRNGRDRADATVLAARQYPELAHRVARVASAHGICTVQQPPATPREP